MEVVKGMACCCLGRERCIYVMIYIQDNNTLEAMGKGKEIWICLLGTFHGLG